MILVEITQICDWEAIHIFFIFSLYKLSVTLWFGAINFNLCFPFLLPEDTCFHSALILYVIFLHCFPHSIASLCTLWTMGVLIFNKHIPIKVYKKFMKHVLWRTTRISFSYLKKFILNCNNISEEVPVWGTKEGSLSGGLKWGCQIYKEA